MNGLERVAAAIDFRETDRAPVIAQVFGHAATFAGVPLQDYVRHGETLASCQLEAWRHYGYDAVFAVMDVNVETEAVGSTLRYRDGQYPVVERYALSVGDSRRSWSGLSVPHPERAGRMPELLKALAILRRELREQVLVVGVLGPFTLATQLVGLESALYLALDDPPLLERLMDFATDVAIAFGQAQLRAGAHLPVVFDPSASPAVLPPELFRQLELPRLRRLFRALESAGAAAGWLHIAGPVARILADYPSAGARIANVDYCVSATEAKRLLPATCLDGNVKAVSFVQGSPAEITVEAASVLAAFRERRGFILSSGCEIPPESPPENVAALVQAAGADG